MVRVSWSRQVAGRDASICGEAVATVKRAFLHAGAYIFSPCACMEMVFREVVFAYELHG
jgi:hypothetical protein